GRRKQLASALTCARPSPYEIRTSGRAGTVPVVALPEPPLVVHPDDEVVAPGRDAVERERLAVEIRGIGVGRAGLERLPDGQRPWPEHAAGVRRRPCRP